MNKKEQEPIDFGDYVLTNHEKYGRAINGNIGPHGTMVGGVGEEAAPEVVLAEYDRLGGLVKTKEGMSLETGTFYDFKNRKPRTDIVLKKKEKPNKSGGTKVTVDETDGETKPKKKKKSPADED